MANKELISELQGKINALQEASYPSDCNQQPNIFEDAYSNSGKNDHRRFAEATPDAEAMTEAQKAFKKIVALVNVSDRSELTIRERLEKAGFGQPAIDDAIERAKGYGFIDDIRFATVLARSRIAQGKGIYGIEKEMLKHHVDPNDVPGWPHEFEVSDEQEFDRALEALDKRPPRSKNLRDGAFRKLVQKGFSVSVASAAARAWSDQQERRY